MSGEVDKSGTGPRKWWRFRFSLRTLLVLMTVFSIWLGVNVHRAQVQRQSVKAFQSYEVGYEYQFISGYGVDRNRGARTPSWMLNLLGEDFFYHVVWLNLNGAAASEPLLKNLHGLPRLRYLGLDNGVVTADVADDIGRMHDLEILSLQMCHISDEHIRRFKHLPNLRELHLTFNSIGDAGLETVGQISSLQMLGLQDTEITDDGLRHLAGLTNLEKLYLSGNNRITDAGLVHLRSLKNLRKLSLWTNRQITNSGLEALRELPNLKELDVSKTGVSKEAAAAFEVSMPGLKVSR